MRTRGAWTERDGGAVTWTDLPLAPGSPSRIHMMLVATMDGLIFASAVLVQATIAWPGQDAHPSCGQATPNKDGSYPSFPGCLRKPPMVTQLLVPPLTASPSWHIEIICRRTGGN